MKSTPIHVTRPFLPPLNEYVKYLEKIWKSGIVTHNGPLVQKLEKELEYYLKVSHMVCVTSGTIALQLAIRALRLEGEIITTPFSFIATPAAIAWEKCRPVFVDIEEDTFNIDPSKIEERISKKTCAILGVHVFSNPCDVKKINLIAQRHKLKIIYDAAHAFGVTLYGKSLLEYGDISAISFHGTKLFPTAEGGGCVSKNIQYVNRLKRLRFFGFNEGKYIVDEGMNGKMHEISAALGLASLPWMDKVKKNRKKMFEHYSHLLSKKSFIKFQKFNPESYNYSYMPIILNSEKKLLKILMQLRAKNIFARRYFYPSLNTLSVFLKQQSCPIAESISRRILCLPLYDSLKRTQIETVCKVINGIV